VGTRDTRRTSLTRHSITPNHQPGGLGVPHGRAQARVPRCSGRRLGERRSGVLRTHARTHARRHGGTHACINAGLRAHAGARAHARRLACLWTQSRPIGQACAHAFSRQCTTSLARRTQTARSTSTAPTTCGCEGAAGLLRAQRAGAQLDLGTASR